MDLLGEGGEGGGEDGKDDEAGLPYGLPDAELDRSDRYGGR